MNFTPHRYPILCYVIGTVILFVVAMAYLDIWEAIASAALLGVVGVSMASVPDRPRLLSWSAGVPAFYGLFFVLLPLLQCLINRGSFDELDHGIAEALVIATGGLLAFWVGTMAIRLTRLPRTFVITNVHWLDILLKPAFLWTAVIVASIALLWSYFFGYIGLLPTRDGDLGNAAGAISGIAFFLPIAHVISWNQFFLQRNRQFLVLGIATTLIILAFGFIANSKTQIVLPFFLIALCIWGAHGKFPVKLIAISILLYVFVAFPLVTASRIALQSEIGQSRSELVHSILSYVLSSEWTIDAVDYTAIASLDRGLLAYFARVVQDAGNTVPLMDGATLVQGLESFVPRVLFAEKPDLNIGNWTAQAFGLLPSSDDVTNVSPTFMGELYMNFSFAGVLLGMFLLGGLSVLIDRYVIVDARSWTMPIMVEAIAWQESFLGHTMLPFIKTVLLLGILLFLARYLVVLTKTALLHAETSAD